ncbi:MAG TPA: alpha/beta fold hydrolase [Kofleriaceae bacterium]|nr:alpha/beta fold hydrolase [Kofleriaceae bacterium]
MQPQTVTANGLRFGYLEHGRGPLVLLVHGFPDTAYTWEHAMPAIAEAGYRAVAPFTRGYAPTEIPPDGDYRAETLAADVVALIEALGEALGETSAVVVGHDWGALAGYLAAAVRPERIRLLVTVGIPHPASIRPGPKLAWSMRHFLSLRGKRGGDRIRRDDFAYVDELYRRWSPAWPDIPADETARVKQMFAEPGRAEAAAAYYRALGLRLPAALKQPVTVPTVAFAGTHDNIAPRAYEKARHCFAASYEVVQVPGGHFMHREHPAEFDRELVRVLRDHDRERAAAVQS